MERSVLAMRDAQDSMGCRSTEWSAIIGGKRSANQSYNGFEISTKAKPLGKKRVVETGNKVASQRKAAFIALHPSSSYLSA